MPDDRLALFHVDRTGAPTIKPRMGKNGGKTWHVCDELTIFHAKLTNQTEDKVSMQDAWSEMAKFSIGLPASALLPGGDILVVYYAWPKTDVSSIHWTRVSLELQGTGS